MAFGDQDQHSVSQGLLSNKQKWENGCSKKMENLQMQFWTVMMFWQ